MRVEKRCAYSCRPCVTRQLRWSGRPVHRLLSLSEKAYKEENSPDDIIVVSLPFAPHILISRINAWQNRKRSHFDARRILCGGEIVFQGYSADLCIENALAPLIFQALFASRRNVKRLASSQLRTASKKEHLRGTSLLWKGTLKKDAHLGQSTSLLFERNKDANRPSQGVLRRSISNEIKPDGPQVPSALPSAPRERGRRPEHRTP